MESRPTGAQLIELFGRVDVRRDKKIDKAYELISASMPDGTPGMVILQHGAALIRAAERATGNTIEPEPVKVSREAEQENYSAGMIHPIEQLIARAEALRTKAMETIYTGRNGEY